MSSSTARPRGGRTACGPCSRRKIRCDSYERQPEACTNCTKRGQPDGCVFNDDAPRSGTRRSRASDGARSPSAPKPKKPRPSEAAQNVLDGIHAASSSYPQAAQQSAPPPQPPASAPPTTNGAQQQPTTSWGAAVNAAPPATSYATKSYNVVPGPQAQIQPQWQPPPQPQPAPARYYAPPEPAQPVYSVPSETQDLFPSHKTVLRYFEVYKTICNPIYPVIADLEDFEAGVCQYVEDMNSGRITYELSVSSGRGKATKLAWLALVTATVATGAQYSDLPVAERDSFVELNVRNAHELLRQAEYLGRPDENCIASLLLLSRIMENDLMPEAAWTTLGMVGRMTDLAGLQDSSFDDHVDVRTREATSIRHRKLYWSYLWQEYSLALCFGKTSMARVDHDDPPLKSTNNYTYSDCMLQLCKLAISARPDSTPSRTNFKAEVDALATARHLDEKALPRLADKANCRTIQDRIEYYSLRISQGFVVSCMSQVLMKAYSQLGWDIQHLQSMCKEGALDCLQAFVDMHPYSVVSLRTWIFVFSALSSALVLAALPDDGDRTKIQSLQRQLLNSLAERDGNNELPHRPGLYAKYPGAINLLREVVHAPEAQRSNGAGKVEEGASYISPITEQQARDLLDPATMWTTLFAPRFASDYHPAQHAAYTR
jgi:hypothetical protein